MAKKKEKQDEPYATATIFFYENKIEAELSSLDGISRRVIDKGVKALFREYHHRRRAVIHAARPKTIENVERISDQPIRHEDDTNEVLQPEAS